MSNSAAVASGAGEVIILDFIVPPKMELHIVTFANNWGALLTWQSGKWTIYRSGSPCPEVQSRGDQFGTLNLPYTFQEPLIFKGGQEFQVRALQTSGASDNASAGVSGGLYG